MPVRSLSRRAFIRRAMAAGAAPTGIALSAHGFASQDAKIRSLDHVAIPILRVEEMVTFYRALGFQVNVTEQRVSVHFGDQKINMHYPSRWQNASPAGLRAPAAVPPCGDFCWVWEGTRGELQAALDRAGAENIAEGERDGGRSGGTRGQSVYVRDPDGNLLEFMRYT